MSSIVEFEIPPAIFFYNATLYSLRSSYIGQNARAFFLLFKQYNLLLNEKSPYNIPEWQYNVF